MTKSMPSFYAIIPSNVRYDKRLIPNAKLLYGELTALSNKKGYCWATNGYFARLYEVSKQTISSWISQLEKYGYIKTKIIYKNNSKEILKRCIKIHKGYTRKPAGVYKKTCRGIQENLQDNNTINNTINNLSKDKKRDKSRIELIKGSNIISSKKKDKIPYLEIVDECLNKLFLLLKKIKPRIHKDKFFSYEEKKLCSKYISFYLKGIPKSNYADLKKWITLNKILYDPNIGFPRKKFRELFDISIRYYNTEHEPADKSRLPNRLSEFLYSQNRNWKSYFLYGAYHPPKKIEIIRKREDKNSCITQKYLEFFPELTPKDDDEYNKLICYIEKIVNFHRSLSNESKNIDNHSFLLYVEDIESFAKRHIEYIKTNQEMNSKFRIDMNKLFVGGYWWNLFVGWLKTTYNLNLGNVS